MLPSFLSLVLSKQIPLEAKSPMSIHPNFSLYLFGLIGAILYLTFILLFKATLSIYWFVLGFSLFLRNDSIRFLCSLSRDFFPENNPVKLTFSHITFLCING